MVIDIEFGNYESAKEFPDVVPSLEPRSLLCIVPGRGFRGQL